MFPLFSLYMPCQRLGLCRTLIGKTETKTEKCERADSTRRLWPTHVKNLMSCQDRDRGGWGNMGEDRVVLKNKPWVFQLTP